MTTGHHPAYSIEAGTTEKDQWRQLFLDRTPLIDNAFKNQVSRYLNQGQVSGFGTKLGKRGFTDLTNINY